MKKKRFTEQQIIGFLTEAEAGMPAKALCPKHGFSDAAFEGLDRTAQLKSPFLAPCVLNACAIRARPLHLP